MPPRPASRDLDASSASTAGRCCPPSSLPPSSGPICCRRFAGKRRPFAPRPTDMTDFVLSEPGNLRLPRRLLDLIPGILLLVAIGYLGKLTEQSIGAYGKAHSLALPNIEYVLWAILSGLVIANTVGVPKIFRAGVATYEFWLKAGIVLLGVRFLHGDVLKLGGVSLALVAVELAVAIAFMSVLGRVFKLRPKLTSLLA